MNVKTLTATILDKMPEIGKWQSEFLIENFNLQCRLRGQHKRPGSDALRVQYYIGLVFLNPSIRYSLSQNVDIDVVSEGN